MGNHRLDTLVIAIRRGFGRGQNKLVVENIEALVFHRAHVEIGDGDNVENVEIIFAAVGCLVPAHRAFQRIHGVAGQRLAAMLDINAKRHPSP